MVIVNHNVGYSHDLVPPTARRCTRISLDGGRTWADGSRAGTPYLNQSTRFRDIIAYSTIAVGKDRFFSAYTIMSEPAGNRRLGSCEGFFWSLTRGSEWGRSSGRCYQEEIKKPAGVLAGEGEPLPYHPSPKSL